MDDELPDVEYLRNLAQRLMYVPVMYGTDQADCDRLYRLARELEAADSRAKDE